MWEFAIVAERSLRNALTSMERAFAMCFVKGKRERDILTRQSHRAHTPPDDSHWEGFWFFKQSRLIKDAVKMKDFLLEVRSQCALAPRQVTARVRADRSLKTMIMYL